MNSPLKYRYNLPCGAIAFGAIFVAGISIYLGCLARDFVGIIYADFMALSAMFAVLALIMMTRRLVFPRTLELTEDAISIPHGFPRTRITRIPYGDIIRIADHGDAPRGGFAIASGLGSFEISASYFANNQSFCDVRDFICSKTSIVIDRSHNQGLMDWNAMNFPKPIVFWKEPDDWPHYRTMLETSKPMWARLAKALWFFARCIGIFLIPWLSLKLLEMPTAPASYYVWLSASVSLFFTSLHWLNATYPVHSTEISLQENGITQFMGKQFFEWNYPQFSGWAVIERHFEGRVLHILLLQKTSYVVALALPDASIRDQVTQLLQRKQVPPSPDLKPYWESSK